MFQPATLVYWSVYPIPNSSWPPDPRIVWKLIQVKKDGDGSKLPILGPRLAVISYIYIVYIYIYIPCLRKNTAFLYEIFGKLYFVIHLGNQQKHMVSTTTPRLQHDVQ